MTNIYFLHILDHILDFISRPFQNYYRYS